MDDRDDDNLEPQEKGEDARDDLLEEQEHKGYGEDEGERGESLPE